MLFIYISAMEHAVVKDQQRNELSLALLHVEPRYLLLQ